MDMASYKETLTLYPLVRLGAFRDDDRKAHFVEKSQVAEKKRKKSLASDSVSLYSASAMAKLTISELKCTRCGHKWYPRKPQKPRNCANKMCNSPYWDRPRRKAKAA